MTKPNAFTMKPNLDTFVKDAQRADRGRKHGIKISASNTPPFRPRLVGEKREVRTQT